ncbi:MAG: O-antigen ligase family protein [Anaerolineae bacterium]
MLIIVLGMAVMIGMMVAQPPSILVIGAVSAVLLALAAMAWPDIATLAVIFIIYSNAAVVAVKFHGVPYIVGASVPVLLVIPLANYLIFRKQKLIINPALPLIIALLVIQLISALFSEHIDIAMEWLINFAIEGVALYFLINNLVRTPKMLRRAIWVLLGTGIIMGGLPLYQQVTGTFDNNYGGFAQTSVEPFGTGVENLQGEAGQFRLAGSLGEQNRHAQIMLMLVPLGLFRMWGERSRWLRALAAVATGLIIIGAALAFSRGAAVAFALLLMIMTFMRFIKPYQIAIGLLAGILLLQVMPQYGARLNTLQILSSVAADESAGISEADTSTQSRVTEMLAAVLVFADHPLIGVGPGVFGQFYEESAKRVGIRVKLGRNRRAHSLLPGIAAETGVLGLFCFLAIVFVTLRDLILTRRRCMQSHPELANMAAGFMLAVISYLLTGIFLHFAFIRFFWLIMALAGAASYVAEERR